MDGVIRIAPLEFVHILDLVCITIAAKVLPVVNCFEIWNNTSIPDDAICMLLLL